MSNTKSVMQMIEEGAGQLWEKWGNPGAAAMTPALERKLREEVVPRWEPPHDATVSLLHTPFGAIKIVTSPYCPPDTVYVGTLEQIESMVRRTEEMYKDKSVE